MKFINSIVKFFNSVINLIISAIVVFSIVIGGYALFDVYQIYNQSDISELDDLKPGTRNFSIQRLQEINKDICGWIKLDDTNIDYPILYGKDNTMYMSKDYKKDFSAGGSIFLDYRSDRYLGNDYSVIYGHNMSGGLMFADVKNFLTSEYFANHKTGKLYLENKVYGIHIYAAAMVNAHEDCVYNLLVYRDGRNEDILKKIDEIASLKNDIEVVSQDKIIALSTCDSAGSDERVVLFAKLEEIENIEGLIQVGEQNENDEIAVEKEQKQKKKLIGPLSARKKRILVLTVIVIIIFIIAIIQSIRNKKYYTYSGKSRNGSHGKNSAKCSASNKKKTMQKIAKQQHKSDQIEQRNMERLLEIENLQQNNQSKQRASRLSNKRINKKGKH